MSSDKVKTIKIELTKEMFDQFTDKKVSVKTWNEFVDSGNFEIGENTEEKLLKYVEEDLDNFIHQYNQDNTH